MSRPSLVVDKAYWIGYADELEAELEKYSEYTICDCCNALTLEPVDAGGHMQCVPCTKLAGREGDLRSVLARRTAALDEAHKAVNKLSALREALRNLATDPCLRTQQEACKLLQEKGE